MGAASSFWGLIDGCVPEKLEGNSNPYRSLLSGSAEQTSHQHPQPMRNTPQPTPAEVEQGETIAFQIVPSGGGRCGEIWLQSGELAWRYAASRDRPSPSRANPFAKPDIVFTDRWGQVACHIRRVAFSPATYEMLDGSTSNGRITLCSVFRNRYRIELSNGPMWDFRMPLFSADFFGLSSTGSRVFARPAPTLDRWAVLTTDESSKDSALLFALAYIHHRPWNQA